MPRKALNLVLDFDGTITTKDTIGTLAEIGLQFQQQRGVDLSSTWQQILADYSRDHSDHVATYKPIANERLSLTEELAFLRGLKRVELRSVQRMEESGIFRNISREHLVEAGDAARRNGIVELRDGFTELMDTARQEGWSVSVVSINWSRSFIKGVLSSYSFDVVANEIEIDGSISGPDVLGPPTHSSRNMCFYRGTIYECKHTECGKKVADCKAQQDFLAGKGKQHPCTERQVHSMNRLRVASKCSKCHRLDSLKARAQSTLNNLRENMEKRKTKKDDEYSSMDTSSDALSTDFVSSDDKDASWVSQK
ncbi:hypothetical protein EsH8_I_000672 [Colletotrichum jinshuiense]